MIKRKLPYSFVYTDEWQMPPDMIPIHYAHGTQGIL